MATGNQESASEEIVEIWKDIPKYTGKYQASSLGRIRSIGSRARILSPTNHMGYLRVSVTKPYKELVHRLVASAFVTNPLGKPEVNHIDGNKVNNTANNLEWVTRSENCKHAYHLGVRPVPNNLGSSHSQAKLTEMEIIYIRRASQENISLTTIATFIGVSHATIWGIIKGRRWTHVKDTCTEHEDKGYKAWLRTVKKNATQILQEEPPVTKKSKVSKKKADKL